MEGIIRGAEIGDAAQLLRIYAPYVTGTCVSFETEVPSLDEFTARLRESLKRYAYLVCEVQGEIVGYAYGAQFRARPAYRYSASTSVYIREGFHRQGIGKALCEALIERLRERGFYTLVAGVALPNPASVGLHRAMGFREVGVYHNVGYKAGGWRDVMQLELALRAYDTPEGEPR
jgi:L-amino acid N-acyltransferase YncA